MKIVVCIKRVPDTEARIKIAAGGQSIDPSGVKYVISPYDEFALETALRLKEGNGEAEVIVISFGDAIAGEQLRTALAMGADRAILLTGQPTFDGLATARVLASELGALGADLILLGMKAVDGDQQQVAPMLAELLDRPCITVAATVAIEADVVVCHREIEGGVEVIEASLPAVVSITKGDFAPRYPSLKGIMAAKKKPLDEKPAPAFESRVNLHGLVPPAERPAGRVVGQGVDAVPELVRVLREEARVL